MKHKTIEGGSSSTELHTRSGFFDMPEYEKPSITILADENQRLNESNSSLEEIQAAHLITDDEIYLLTQNYRNTYEIALLSSFFYTG